MKGGCRRRWYRLGVPADRLVWSAARALVPAQFCRVPPRRQPGLNHRGQPSLTSRVCIMPRRASRNGRARGKRQFKFHQSRGGVRRGLIRWQALLITYSGVSSRVQTSRYSGLSVRLVCSHSKYKIWIWKAVISSLPDQKDLKSYVLPDHPLSEHGSVLCEVIYFCILPL